MVRSYSHLILEGRELSLFGDGGTRRIRIPLRPESGILTTPDHDTCAAIPARECHPLLPNATAYFRLTPMLFCYPFVFLCLAVDTRRSPSPQVLNVGGPCTLVERLVRIVPYICKGHHPLMGTFAATYRIANHRLEHMGRRSKARKLAPGYVSVDGRHCVCDAFLFMFSIAWGARKEERR